MVSTFAPKQMSMEEIDEIILNVLKELGLTDPTMKDKGQIMKLLMPKVKGKADGKLVNNILQGYLG